MRIAAALSVRCQVLRAFGNCASFCTSFGAKFDNSRARMSNGAQGLLDRFYRVGTGGRRGLPAVVGARSHDSDRRAELVAGISQRLVLIFRH